MSKSVQINFLPQLEEAIRKHKLENGSKKMIYPLGSFQYDAIVEYLDTERIERINLLLRSLSECKVDFIVDENSFDNNSAKKLGFFTLQGFDIYAPTSK